jgi:hypothetical protein
MNVLILQLDGKMMNLAAGKLLAWHVAAGDRVELRHAANWTAVQPRLGDPIWDRVYGSLIFERTRPLAERVRRLYPQIELGGTGWDFVAGVQVSNTVLPAEIEALRPDYTGWPKMTSSLGYTHRGFRLSCGFCVIPRKEGKIRTVGSLRDVWRGDPWPKDLILLDNDFFGQENWRELVAEAIRDGYRLCWNQGINARFLDDETCAAIASVRYMDDQFERPRLYTAWDGRKDERRLFRGLEALKRHGVLPNRVLVYMLIGYESGETHADRDDRRVKLRAFGCRPYPMPYVRAGELGAELVAFQRWCVQRKDEHVTWEKWWGQAKGQPRRLGTRRVSLPLFDDDAIAATPAGGKKAS